MYSESTVLFSRPITSGSDGLSVPSSEAIPDPKEEEYETDFHLGMRAPMSLTVYLHVDQLWVAMLISINHKNLLITLVLTAKTVDKDNKSCLVRPRLPFNPILHSSQVSIISHGTFLGSSNESLFPLTQRLNDPPFLYISTCLILLSFRS